MTRFGTRVFRLTKMSINRVKLSDVT